MTLGFNSYSKKYPLCTARGHRGISAKLISMLKSQGPTWTLRKNQTSRRLLHPLASISLKLQMQYSSLMALSCDSNVIMKEDIIDGIKAEYRKEGKVTDWLPHKITEPATLTRVAGASPTLFGFQGHCANLVYPFVLHANLARRGFWTSFPCYCKILTNPNRRINQTVASCSTECISKRIWIKNHCA